MQIATESAALWFDNCEIDLKTIIFLNSSTSTSRNINVMSVIG